MKLVFFDEFVPGVLRGGEVVDISPALGDLRVEDGQQTLQNIIENFEQLKPGLDVALESGEGKNLSEVRLRQPVPRPRKVLCMIGNYKEGVQRPIRPIDTFLKSPESIVGPGDTVILPKREHPIFHHEAELGIIIGKDSHEVTQANAMDHIFGYTAFVDVSARGAIGKADSGAGSFFGKSYATFGPIGPCIVTKDEIKDPQALAIKLWVNGQLRHDYNTDDMEHPIPEIIEFTTSVTPLLTGDIIACGTNHQGLGPLQDGDTGTISISEIGEFSFDVSDPYKRNWKKEVDEIAAERVRKGESPLANQYPSK
jgi:2-keto-4-pentenoate hydratase/2-oxohepta-3-ene-1,7-dioic acid hydratase in catechol pathway|tara:strand:- start:10083 stop:11015 length:933 start_codon:yes stop_codon:yes gene_type:complete